MTVEKVHVPGYLISPTLLLSHQPTPLSAFGSVLFNLLCQANHLQTSTNNDHSMPLSTGSESNINPAILTVTSPVLPALEGPLREVAESNLNEPSPMDIWTERFEDDVVTDEPVTQNITSSLIDPATSSAMSQLLLDF